MVHSYQLTPVLFQNIDQLIYILAEYCVLIIELLEQVEHILEANEAVVVVVKQVVTKTEPLFPGPL